MEKSISTGCVVIGRNEGERLKKCLATVLEQVDKIIYVDSGSTDGSVEFAKKLGISTFALDLTIPFSAGRARNEGAAKLVNLFPEIKFIQFIDGDCILYKNWISIGEKFLIENVRYSIIAGNTVELYPEKSIYNQLCDIEWKVDAGEVQACGGIFLIRTDIFNSVKGFNETVVAGEEPELCYRIRKGGGAIYHIDVEMVKHDANIIKFPQWWKRTRRSGYAYANGYFLHRKDHKGYCLKDLMRIYNWALFFPGLILIIGLIVHQVFFCLYLIYPVQVFRIFFRARKYKLSIKKKLLYSVFTVLGKFSQFTGQLIYIYRFILKKKKSILEYK